MAKQLVMPPPSSPPTYLPTPTAIVIIDTIDICRYGSDTAILDTVLATRKIDVAINKICKSELSSISKWIAAAERNNLASLIIILKIKSSNYVVK